MRHSWADYDPEDLTGHERQSDDEGRAATSAGREHYFEVGYVTIEVFLRNQTY